MRKTLIIFLSLFSLSSFAQAIQSTSDAFPGIQSSFDDKYYLSLSDHEFLYAGEKLNSNDATLIKLTKDCKTDWSIPSVDGFLSAAKFGNYIIAFSAKAYRRMGMSFNYYKSIHAMLIDNTNGQIKVEKDVPTYTDNALTSIYVVTDEDQNFKYLILRTTQQEKITMIGAFKSETEYGNTSNLQAITFDNTLNVKANTFNIASIQNAQFINCTSNSNGDLFIITLQNNLLSVNKYVANSTVSSETITAKTNFQNDVAVLSTGDVRIKNNSLLLVFIMDEEKKNASTLITATFNFDDKKGFIQQDLMDKDYLKQYGEKNGHLFTIGCEFYNDKVIVLKEIESENTSFVPVNGNAGNSESQTTFTYQPIIVSVYSNDMHLLKEFQIEEGLRIFEGGFGSAGYKIINNKLFLFFNSDKGRIGIKTKYQSINLDNFSLDKENEFDLDAKLKTVLYGPGIVWFNNTGLFPFAEQKLLAPNKINTTFKTIQF